MGRGGGKTGGEALRAAERAWDDLRRAYWAVHAHEPARAEGLAAQAAEGLTDATVAAVEAAEIRISNFQTPTPLQRLLTRARNTRARVGPR